MYIKKEQFFFSISIENFDMEMTKLSDCNKGLFLQKNIVIYSFLSDFIPFWTQQKKTKK